MNLRLHQQARTTPARRREIQSSSLRERALARRYHTTRSTLRQWKPRDAVEDASQRPHHVQTTLTAAQEQIVVYLRTALRLPLAERLAVTRECLHPAVSRSGLERCWRRQPQSPATQGAAACREALQGVRTGRHAQRGQIPTGPRR